MEGKNRKVMTRRSALEVFENFYFGGKASGERGEMSRPGEFGTMLHLLADTTQVLIFRLGFRKPEEIKWLDISWLTTPNRLFERLFPPPVGHPTE
ncbi:hypothetical protein AAMO2058_000523500 [Amorphochlora amoebiformis]